MIHEISSLVCATGNTAIPKARKYFGIALLAGVDAATVTVYRGGAATAGNQVGLAQAGIGLKGGEDLNFPADVDAPPPGPGLQPTTSGLFVVVTGTAPVVIVRFSP